jgi:hypothetical protein
MSIKTSATSGFTLNNQGVVGLNGCWATEVNVVARSMKAKTELGIVEVLWNQL